MGILQASNFSQITVIFGSKMEDEMGRDLKKLVSSCRKAAALMTGKESD